MRFELLARRLFAATIVLSICTGGLFVAGAYFAARNNNELSDSLIYLGTAAIVFTAVAASDTLIMTIIEAIMWWRNERRHDAEDC